VNSSIQGALPTVSGCTMSINLFGLFVCTGLIGISTTQTVTVPITLFADHPFLNPLPPASGAPDTGYWFLANNWHYVTYYAISAGHAPTGSHDCVASSNCLTVNVQGSSAWTNRRALLALAGRSLTGTTGTNRLLYQYVGGTPPACPSVNCDFLDVTENANGDNVFAQNRITNAFNDRFVSLSP
jgi:hypothetical protein